MKKITIIVYSLFAIASYHVQAQSFETATEAVKNMGVGWNLGNALDAYSQSKSTNPAEDAYWGQQGLESQTCWGQALTKPELLKMMKEAGFGAIRVPVTWYNHMDKQGNVNAEWMKRVHEVVDYVISQGMYCILNVHHDTGADASGFTAWIKADESNFTANKARYEYLWRQIATEFKDYDQKLLFESYNEMIDIKNSWNFASFAAAGGYDATIAKSAYSAINQYAQCFVDLVRSTGGNNAKRNLIVNTYAACCGSGTWNSHLKEPLKEMTIPTDATAGSGHIAVQVHFYPSVKNINNLKAEIDDMFSALKTYIIDKGAPVIVGEWGSANDGEVDYDVRRSNVLQFADYFVRKAKAYACAAYYWMGLSDGSNRTLPVFNQPDLAKAIVGAYHGSTDGFNFPTRENQGETVYDVTFSQQWSELNLYSGSINTSTFKAIELELAEKPASGAFQIKIYGSSKETLNPITAATTKLTFTSALGTTISRITLQSNLATNTTTVKSVNLIKADGSKQAAGVSPFWGCTISERIITGIRQATASTRSDSHIYNLSGQRVDKPSKGIYIQNGKKFINR